MTGALSILELSTFAALLLASPPKPERADDRIVGVRFANTVPLREQGHLRESLAAMLPETCEPPPCMEDCGEDAPTLGVEIAGDSRDYVLQWNAWDPRLDSPLRLESSCELCSLIELEDQLATDLDALCTRLDALDMAPGRVHVSSEPSGARLRIDGDTRGRTPWIGELPAGDHMLEVNTRGRASQARTVWVVGGVEEHEHFELLATRRRPEWPGWLSMGLGVAMSLAGSTLIALHDKDWSGRCSGADVDANGSCRFVYATRPLGIGLTAAGAGAMATGIGLMVWAQHDSADRASLGLSWKGRF
ncbi:PEGA domain-containing protein [Enhygromyxa salina]|uniref:PEGA domain-containing protein n=1 Tax=Enhygromyxa salina TaxID=215803 RepID=UPI0015E5C883|nr:PEGA domain-containing protein [Enhygromyxa salina]